MELISSDIGLALCFLVGVIIQCLSLLREMPKKWAFITFFGMLVYMAVLMGYSLFQLTEIRLLEPILSLGMVFGFLFISIFLKEVLSIIDEKVIFSLTISYWFLLFYYGTSLYPASSNLLIEAGIFFTIVTILLIRQKTALKPLQKFLLYGWYLAINGIFALLYISHLPYPFHLLHTGIAAPWEMLILGMLTIQLLYNFGILYYVFIYSLMVKGIRQQIIAQTKTLFTDQQISRKDIISITVSQCIAFIPLYFFRDSFGITLLAIWILLTPLITLLLKHYAR